MQIMPLSPAPDDRKVHRWHRAEHVPAFGAGGMARRVFAYFQNLNLRVLIEDLRRGRVVSGNWTFDHDLCPVAHGIADGRTVCHLQYVSQAADLMRACELAAEQIGASPRTIYHLVTTWDAGDLGPQRLLAELEALWAERLADAQTVQALLCPSASIR